MHSSGEWLEGEFIIPCKLDAFGIGSAIAYARRYGLQSAAGVPAEDDDGRSSVAKEPKLLIITQQLTDISNAQNLKQLLAAFREGQQFVSGKEGGKEALAAIIDAKDKRKKELS